MGDPINLANLVDADKSILSDIRLTYYLLDNGMASIFIINTNSGKIVDVNSTACLVFGYTREEFLFMNSSDIESFIPPDPNWHHHIEQIKKSNKIIEQFTYKMYKKKNGSSYPVEISTIDIDFDNEPYTVLFAKDISDRMAYEEKIFFQQQALALTTKMAALGEMSEGIAHEINSPLAIIKLSANQLSRMFETEQPDKKFVQDRLAKIQNTVERIAQIISGLLRYSGETGEEAFMTYNLSKIVDDCENLCKEKIASKGIAYKVIKPANPVEINCRPGQIAQAIMNLMDNAIEAALKTDTDNRWIELEIIENDLSVIINVKDCGAGVSLDIKNKIFDPFFTLKAIGQGPGLGLSIAKGIIESHEGTLTLSSTSSPTTFTINLAKFSF